MSPIYVPGKVTLKYETVSPLLLDSYSGAAAAYSLRQLSWAYGGPVVRVRRDNDNAEQDFTATEVSDGTLTAWVGAGNDGFVHTLYDQTGNTNNAVQTSTSSQPRIINAGVLTLENGKPCLSAVINSSLEFSPLSIAQPFTVFSVYKASQAASPVFGSDAGAATATGARRLSDEYIMYAGIALAGGIHPSTQQLFVGLFNGASSKGWWQSVERLSGNVGTGATIAAIGRNSVDYFKGTIQEIVVYSGDQTSSRTAIEANINAHYSIY